MLGTELTGKIWHLCVTWAVLPSNVPPISLLANALFSAPVKGRLPPLYELPLPKSIQQGIMNPNHNGAENERDERVYNDREIGGFVSGGLVGARDANLTDTSSGKLAEENNASFARILSGRLAAMRETLQGSHNEKLGEKFVIQSVLQTVLAHALEEHQKRHNVLKEIVLRGNYDMNSHKNWFVFSDQEKMKFVLNSVDLHRNNAVSVPLHAFQDSEISGEQYNIPRIIVNDGVQKKPKKISNTEDGESVTSKKSPEVTNTNKQWLKTADFKPSIVQQVKLEKKNRLRRNFRPQTRQRRDNKAIMYLPVGSTDPGPGNDCPDSVDAAAVSISQLVFLSLCLGVFTAVANVANNINNNNNNNNNNNDNNINSNNLNFAANANAGNQITVQIPPGRRRKRDSILSAVRDRVRRRVFYDLLNTRYKNYENTFIDKTE